MFFNRKKKDGDLAEEIASHLRMAEQDSGKDVARREFGNVGLVKEVTREIWGGASLERRWHDLRCALRVLQKNRGYTVTAVLSLALGIGANTAIFSLIDSIMLQSLPVKNPQDLVALGDPTAVQSISTGSAGNVHLFSYPFYQRFRTENGVFSDLYASGRSVRIDLKDEAEHPPTRFVSDNYFSVLGVNLSQGRAFLPDDRETVVISHDFWRRHFPDESNMIGRKLVIDRRDFTIIGVAPREFFGDVVGYQTDLWLPLEVESEIEPGQDYLHHANSFWLQLMGRRKLGVTMAQVSQALNTVGLEIIREQAAPFTFTGGSESHWTEEDRRAIRCGRLFPHSSHVHAYAQNADGAGRLGALDLLRERRQSANCPCGQPWTRDGSSSRHWRESGSFAAPASN